MDEFLQVKYKELDYALKNNLQTLYKVVADCIAKVEKAHPCKQPQNKQLTLF